MPNITQYDAGNLGLNPTGTGVNATAQAARRINSLYEEVAQSKGRTVEQLGHNLGTSIRDAGAAAVDYVDHQQITHGAAAMAQKTFELTEKWNNIAKTADPNDTTVGPTFLKSFEDDITDFRKAFTTEKSQAWAETRIDALRNHLYEKTSADMASRAYDALKINVRQTVNMASNTARLDPSSIEHQIDFVKHSVQEFVSSSSNLKGAAASKVQQEMTESAIESIVKAGALGAIENAPDPDAAARMIAAKYPKYVNGAELQQLVSAARQQVRMRRLEDEAGQRQQHTQNVRAVNDFLNKNMIQNVEVNDDGSIRVKPGFLTGITKGLTMPDAPHSELKQEFNWAQTNIRRKDIPVKDEPTVVSDLTQKVFDPDNPTTRLDLMKANAAGNLSDASFTRLDRLVKEVSGAPKDPAFKTAIAAAKQTLEVNIPGLPGRHPEGAARYAAFVQDFYTDYIKAKKAGTLDHNALDMTDPGSMISKFVKSHDVPASQKLSEYMSAVREMSVVTVPTEAAANALPKGTRFKLPDGRTGMVQ